ncbi:MAG: hypothetical protein GX825_04820 [Syntrophomonadaceae bacterium]|nr:hypothetical protein [Syntrophomonadaceae bacterium]
MKQARRVAIEGIGIDDTCLENYLVLIELARRENGSDTYYSYLLLTSSTSSALVLEKELKEHGVEVKFLSSEETTFEPTEENTAEISEQDNTSSSTQQKETEQEDRNNQQNTAKNEDENKKTEAVNYPPVTTVISLSENGKGQLSKSNVTLHLGQELIIKCGSGCNYIKLMTSDVISFDLFSWRTAGEYTGPSSAEQYILKATRLGTAYIDVWPNADGSYSAALTVNIIN